MLELFPLQSGSFRWVSVTEGETALCRERGKVERITVYLDHDRARAGAERFAKERG